MLESLPQSVREELRAAQSNAERKRNRLRVEAGGISHPIFSMLPEGFVVDRATASNLRGLVDIYDGGRHLSQCLIVASESDGHRMHYEFKRNTSASDGAPLDFERAENAPIALLPR